MTQPFDNIVVDLPGDEIATINARGMTPDEIRHAVQHAFNAAWRRGYDRVRGLPPAKRDLGAGDTWARAVDTDEHGRVTIFGVVLTPDEYRQVETTETVQIIDRFVRAGFRFSRMFSRVEPDGSSQFVHVADATRITRETFVAAHDAGWEINCVCADPSRVLSAPDCPIHRPEARP